MCDDVLDLVLSAIGDLTLSVGGDGSGPSSSRRPPLDLNVPAAEAESAPPSDPRALELEEKNLRLRQENAELHRTLGEARERIEAVLDQGERHIKEVKEQDQARQQAWSAYREEMYRDYERWKALERENARMRFRVNERSLKKKGPLAKKNPFFSFFSDEVVYNNLNRTSLGWAYLHP